MKLFKYITPIACSLLITACQNNDYQIEDAKIAPINSESISGQLVGDDYVWSWQSQSGLDMVVSTYTGGTLTASEVTTGNTYTHRNIDTNVDFTYVFRLTDGQNQSQGVIKNYTRPGASKISGLALSQLEVASGYDMYVEWDSNPSASSIQLSASNGVRVINETLSGSATDYTVSDVRNAEEWTVTLVALNDKGSSLSTSSSLKIGNTAIGFLSVYPTVDDLQANGDDDEICAWLWLTDNYPSARYLYFGDINSANTLESFRVLFWLRDLEDVPASEVFEYPDCVNTATNYIKDWYLNGGNLLLWSHATAYIGALGRIDSALLKAANAIGTGAGGYNGDVWRMAVSLNPAGSFSRDHSNHPIYRGLTVESNDRCKLIPFKGAGWTEDHNCLYFDIPTALTGLGNQDEACYTQLTETYGIYPLGTWDSQIDFVSQLNVWEAQQGNTEYKGTVLCIGNGGCEFSMKNEDGTPDINAYPKNNAYQDNVLRLVKNSLEYLKTR